MTYSRSKVAVIALVLGVVFVGALYFTTGLLRPDPRFQERLLTTIPQDYEEPHFAWSPSVSPDGRRVAYWANRNGKWSVVVDGQKGAEFDFVLFEFHADPRGGGSIEQHLSNPVFSADSRHLAYIVEQNGKKLVMLDGQKGPLLDSVSDVVFSPQGHRLAYAGKQNGRRFVIVDGQRGPEFDAVSDPIFSADGSHLAYSAVLDGKEFLVFDGKQGDKYDHVSVPRFAPAGQRLAFIAVHDRQNFIVLDGEPGPRFETVSEPILSADGRHLAYWARQHGKWFVVVDGQKGPEFDNVTTRVEPDRPSRLLNIPVFSADGQHLAYWATQAEKWFVILDGHKGPEFDVYDVGVPVFSSDGRHLAYRTNRKADLQHPASEGWCITLDGQTGPGFFDVGDPVFSPDNRRVAYRARLAGGWSVIPDFGANEIARQLLASMNGYDPALSRLAISGDDLRHLLASMHGYDGVDNPVFSPDSRHIAYVAARNNRQFVIVDRRKSPEYDQVSDLQFNPGGRRIAYIARFGREVWWKVIDVS